MKNKYIIAFVIVLLVLSVPFIIHKINADSDPESMARIDQNISDTAIAYKNETKNITAMLFWDPNSFDGTFSIYIKNFWGRWEFRGGGDIFPHITVIPLPEAVCLFVPESSGIAKIEYECDNKVQVIFVDSNTPMVKILPPNSMNIRFYNPLGEEFLSQ